MSRSAGLMGGKWRSVFQDRGAALGIGIVLLIVLAAIFASVISPFDPFEQNTAMRLRPPSWDHWLGTDQFGRDVFSRIIYGSRISLYVGISAVIIGGVIGTAIGLAAGYFRGWFDNLVGWFTDVMMSFPTEVLAIIVIVGLGASSTTAVIAIGVVFISRYIRLIRAATLATTGHAYIEAAKVVGQSHTIIMVRHILPNILGDTIIMTSLWVATAIRVEAVLGFLGLGAQPPQPSWGVMIKDGLDTLLFAPWLAIVPGMAIFITVLGFNLLGDSFRDYIDPKLQR
ncbi:MAG: ABC transporter permease [Alphaproteobacteria bacterium]|nr:ABC transporter permease [Alphaproteobacteria bacterium]